MDVARARTAPFPLPLLGSALFLAGVLALSSSALADGPARAPAQEEETPAAPEEEVPEKPEPTPPPKSAFTQQVTVTATRIETPSSKVASTLTVITAEEMERKQVRLIVDALREVPGVDVRRTGGPGSVTSLFIRGNDSDHTLVLVDGVEMNDPSSPSRLPLVADLTPDEVDRIEVLRGPQSTLYGSDAIGGVISLFTKKGKGEPVFSAWAEGGSYATLREGLSVSGAAGEFNYSFGASHTDTDGFSARAGGTEQDSYRSSSVNGRFGWDFGEGAALDFFVRRTDAQVAFDAFSTERGNQIDVEQTLFKAEPHFALLGGRWEQRVGLQAVRHVRDTTGSTPGLVEGDLFTLAWQNDLHLHAGQTLTLGAEGERERAEFPGFSDRAGTTAVYAQQLFETGRGFFGTAGVRLDDHSEFGSQATYRLGGGYTFAPPRLTLRASYGTGFKAPSLSQLNPTAFGGNPNLNPEHARGADLGIEQEAVPGRLLLGATLFWDRIDDLIVAVFDPVTLASLNFNVDEAETRGGDATVVLRPLPSLHLKASYTYTHTEALGTPVGFGLTEGSRLLRRPTHKASLDAHAALFGGKTDLTLTALYVGQRADIHPQTFAVIEAPGYFVLNLGGSHDLSSHVRLFARVENLLNREYEDVPGFSTARISAYGGLRIGF